MTRCLKVRVNVVIQTISNNIQKILFHYDSNMFILQAIGLVSYVCKLHEKMFISMDLVVSLKHFEYHSRIYYFT